MVCDRPAVGATSVTSLGSTWPGRPDFGTSSQTTPSSAERGQGVGQGVERDRRRPHATTAGRRRPPRRCPRRPSRRRSLDDGVAQVLVGVLVPAELLHDHARLDAQPGRHAGAVDAHPCCSSMGVTAAGRSVGGWCPVVGPDARGRVTVAHEVRGRRWPRGRGSTTADTTSGEITRTPVMSPLSLSPRQPVARPGWPGVRFGARHSGPRWRKRRACCARRKTPPAPDTGSAGRNRGSIRAGRGPSPSGLAGSRDADRPDRETMGS